MDDPRFLIDECLARALVPSAKLYGYDAAHVADLGFRRATDAEVAAEAIRQGAVLVTANARDFRRIYAQFDTHPGLVVLPGGLPRGEAIRRFEGFLETVPRRGRFACHVVLLAPDGQDRTLRWPPAM